MYRKGVNSIQLLSPNVIKEGDTANSFLVELLDADGEAVDISDADVTWSLANRKGRVITEKTAIKESGTGRVRLQIDAGDSTGSGRLSVQIDVTKGSNTEVFPADGDFKLFIEPNQGNLNEMPVAYATVDDFNTKVSITLTKTNEAVSKANEANSKADQTQQQLDNVILENGNSDAEVVQARGDYDVLYKRFEPLEDVNPSLEAIWDVPEMPNAFRDFGVIPDSSEPDENLDALFEPLVDGGYVTKSVIGRDASDTYDIMQYDFTPKNYEKTIILTSCLHGNEYTGFYWMAQFVDLLVNEWHKYPQLAYLRKNVRIITVPIVNPWGFANSSRQNVNQVDLNRNFDYNWSQYDGGVAGDTHYKGSAPESEVETQHMRAFFQQYSNAVAHLDFHTITTLGEQNYVAFYPRYEQTETKFIYRTINGLMRSTDKQLTSSSNLPAMVNWTCRELNINSVTAEFVNLIYGDIYRESVEMTEVMRWFGNLTLSAARLNKPKVEAVASAKSWLVEFTESNTSPITLLKSTGDGDYLNIDPLITRFTPEVDGIFKLDGYAKVSVADASSEVGFLPLLYQPYAPNFSFSDVSQSDRYGVRDTLDVGDHVLPLHNAIPVSPTVTDSSLNRVGEATFRLRATRMNTSATVTLKEVRVILTFIPTSGVASHEQLTVTNGALETVYPNPNAATSGSN